MAIESRLAPVAEAIRRGDKAEAVRLLRTITGMPLAEATHAVERLAAESEADGPLGASTGAPSSGTMEFPDSGASATAGASPSEPSAIGTSASEAGATAGDCRSELQRDLAALRAPRDPNVPPLEGALAEEVLALAMQRKYLDAIKLVRARTGADLKTAKDQVEALMLERGIAAPRNRSCLAILLAILVLLIGLIALAVIPGATR